MSDATVRFRLGTIATPPLIVDRLAAMPGRLLCVSLIAENQRIKQVRAILSQKTRATITFNGFDAKQGYRHLLNHHSILAQEPHGYASHVHKIGYGQAHAVFVSRNPGFFPVVTPESLWRELSGPRFNTPILPEWMPYIEARIRELGHYQECYCFGCESGILDLDNVAFDAIVQHGIRSGAIAIPPTVFVPGPDGKIPAPLAEIRSMDDYLNSYGSILGSKAADSLVPLHRPGIDPLPDFSRIVAHNPARTPFPAQHHAIAAAIRMLETSKGGFIGGEQGVGKTLLSMLICDDILRKPARRGGRGGRYRAMVVCPDHLIDKWGREIADTIPGATVRNFDHWSEILSLARRSEPGEAAHWTRPDGPEWYILGRNQIKWYPDWESIAEPRGDSGPISRRVLRNPDRAAPERTAQVTQCPRCGTIVRDKQGIAITPANVGKSQRSCDGRYLAPFADPMQPDQIAGADEIWPLPTELESRNVGSEVTWGGRSYVIRRCGERLWNYTASPYRWPMARIIHKKLRRFFDSVILDECFPGDTMIAMPHGDKQIKEILPGDMVASWDGSRTIPRKVVRVIIRDASQGFVRVTHRNGRVLCTPNHKFHTINRGYVAASLLRHGDTLIFAIRGDCPINSPVESVSPIHLGDRAVYDLEVEDTHCYFAEGVLVSNCHELKADSSAQSMAAGKLIASTRYCLAMTGTLIGGYANHLYPLLYRIAGRSLREEGFEWGKDLAFSEAYGRVDRIVTTKESLGVSISSSTRSMRRDVVGKSTERKAVRPGIMPTLFGRHLISSSLFITLDEMAADLPPFREYVSSPLPGEDDLCDVCVDMSAAQQGEYDRIEDALKSANTELLQRNSQRLLGAYLWTLLDYPDRPWGWTHPPGLMHKFERHREDVRYHLGSKAADSLVVPHTVGYWDGDPGSRLLSDWVGVVTPADLPSSVVYPKEQRLIEIIRSEYDRGCQTWIYAQMTNKRDIQPRLAALLSAQGIRVGILRARDVPVRQREDWILRNGHKYDVIISHPQLVCTGLELFAKNRHNYSSIVFYQAGYSPFVLGQAARRAWRIGQTKPCRVYYLHYRDSMGHKALKLMGLKAAASRALEGRFTLEGLAAVSGDVSMQMALAKGLADHISDADMRRSWDRLGSAKAAPVALAASPSYRFGDDLFDDSEQFDF